MTLVMSNLRSIPTELQGAHHQVLLHFVIYTLIYS